MPAPENRSSEPERHKLCGRCRGSPRERHRGAGAGSQPDRTSARGLWPIEIAAGVADIVKDENGKVVLDEDGPREDEED
jgi:hypothetical protein